MADRTTHFSWKRLWVCWLPREPAGIYRSRCGCNHTPHSHCVSLFNKSPSLQVETHPLLLHFIHLHCSSLFLFIQSPNESALFRCVNHMKVLRLQGLRRLNFQEYDIRFLYLQQVTLMRMNRLVWIQIPPRDACFQRKPCQIKAQRRTSLELPISRRIRLLCNLREFSLNSFYVNK